jgi:hypothetical protein
LQYFAQQGSPGGAEGNSLLASLILSFVSSSSAYSLMVVFGMGAQNVTADQQLTKTFGTQRFSETGNETIW